MANPMLDDDDGDGLSWLSEEERAALDDDDGETDLLREIASEDDDTDGDDDPDDGDEAQSEPTAQDKPAKPIVQSASEVEEPPQQPFQPVYVASLPADFEARSNSLAEAGKKLAEAYENGDMDLKEFQVQQRQLNEQEWQLRAAVLKAEMAKEQQQQTMAQRWAWEQEAYFRRPEHRAFRDDPVISHAFEGALKLLAADQANENRDMPWFLEQAGQMTRDKLRDLAKGLGLDGRDNAGAGTEHGNGRGALSSNTGRNVAKTNPPPSLARVPAAAMPDPGVDEFAYLDKLSGLAAERALAKLSQDQLDRYLSQ